MRTRTRPGGPASAARSLLVLAILVLVGAWVAGLTLPRVCHALHDILVGGASAAAPVACRGGNVLAGVYTPSRLVLHGRCVAVTGRVVGIIHAPDGDVHLNLLPDHGYWHLLDRRNYTVWGGTLVLEIIPADQGTVAVPKLLSRVRVTGAWVTDKEHGWNELHPAWQIVPAS